MVGTIIGTYRLEELLGDGGLGGVYRAVDGASGKEAAFRVFAREVSADAILADRLRAMAPALKKLQHPNIAAFFELVTVGADLALFLEYVPGASLEKVKPPTGRLEINVSVSCAVQVLRALEFAHSTGVLHHALRPSNVMVTKQGTVKVLDFGIGHAFGANRKTREDRLLTVLAYLAPEQIQNQPGDARADIYAVGVLLYELLTGQLPFGHKTEFALRQAHLAEPPAAPRTVVPDMPEWLDQAVLRALAKNPASRYQNATEFRAVLEAALGLSTSREAAIVRQRDGAQTETFAAAPPIPPLPSPPPGGATGQIMDVPHGPAATSAVPSAMDTAETVMASATVRSAEATASATVAAPPPAAPTGTESRRPSAAQPPAARPGRTRGLALLAASVLVLIGLVGSAAYFWLRGPSTGTPAAVTPSDSQAETPPPSPPVTVQVEATSSSSTAAAPAVTPPSPTPEASVSEAPPAQASPPPANVSAAPAPTSSPAGSGAKPPSRPTPPPGRRAQAKPESGAKPAPPPAPSPAPAAAPPPTGASAPNAAVKPDAKNGKAPDVSYRKVKLVTQAGSTERSTDVVLLFSDDRLSVTPAGGGAALRTVRYDEITAASYSKAQKKRLGFIKSAQHLLEIDTAGEPLLLRLDKDNFEAILAAIGARSGQAVSR